jgi:hypothetical protein
MIGTVIAVGQHIGRWLYVTRVDEASVYGRIWKPSKNLWAKQDVWYAREAIDKTPPKCPRPAPPNDTLVMEAPCGQSDSGVIAGCAQNEGSVSDGGISQ